MNSIKQLKNIRQDKQGILNYNITFIFFTIKKAYIVGYHCIVFGIPGRADVQTEIALISGEILSFYNNTVYTSENKFNQEEKHTTEAGELLLFRC